MAFAGPSTPSSASKTAGGSSKGSILALDYGRVRIGMAIAAEDSSLPEPLGVLERVNRNEDMRRLRELARARHVTRIVVGLPLRLDGTRGEMAEEAERFAERIRKQAGVPVSMVDERLTSWEAERLLEETAGRARRTGKASEARRKPEKAHHREPEEGKRSVDAVAAAVILKEFLEQNRPGGATLEPVNSAENR